MIAMVESPHKYLTLSSQSFFSSLEIQSGASREVLRTDLMKARIRNMQVFVFENRRPRSYICKQGLGKMTPLDLFIFDDD